MANGIGLDILGFAHPKWPVKDTRDIWPIGFGGGCFDEESREGFGRSVKKVAKFLNTFGVGHVPYWRFQAQWSNSHRLISLSELKKKLPDYQAIQRDFPHITFLISHTCEYDTTSSNEIKKRTDLIKNAGLIPVNSRYKGPIPSGVYYEDHANNPHNKAAIISTDGAAKGQGSIGLDADKWRREGEEHAYYLLLWAPLFNLRENMEPGDLPPPPAERTKVPSKVYMSSVCRLGFPEGTPPIGVFNSTPIKAPDVYKSFAEDKFGSNDPRENKPCLIIKSSARHVNVIDKTGTSHGKLINGGTFEGGRHRFYAGLPGGIKLYGGEIGSLAIINSGSEWVWFDDGRNIWGPVNPAFRRGTFLG